MGEVIGSKILIVIPTYNERENLRLLAEEILQRVPGVHILVVDDNSPDGTGEEAETLSKQDSRIHVMHRQGKQGLGTAYIAGFRWALERSYEFVFEMDCDFSHQPRFLPAFLEAAESADVVLGSRYIRGGGTENWTLLRKFISYGGNTYARTVLGLPFKDVTGGFKCFRRSVLEALPFDELLSTGYSFQIELTTRAHRMGFKIVEVPIVFPDRTRGASKMSGTIFKEAFINVLKLRSIK